MKPTICTEQIREQMEHILVQPEWLHIVELSCVTTAPLISWSKRFSCRSESHIGYTAFIKYISLSVFWITCYSTSSKPETKLLSPKNKKTSLSKINNIIHCQVKLSTYELIIASLININIELGKENITYNFLVNNVRLWPTGYVAGMNIRNAYRVFGGEAFRNRPYKRPKDGTMIWTLIIRNLI